MDEYLVSPGNNWSDKHFEEASYSRWAAEEIVQLLLDRPLDSPDEVIFSFILKMALYAQVAKTYKKRRIFSISEDTAEDILHLFY